MRVPAPRRAANPRRFPRSKRPPNYGGSTFAELPEVEAPDARIIWHADFDPGTVRVAALPIDADHPDAVDPGALKPWLATVADADGEHVVLSDGWRHIRVDVAQGSLAAGRPVVLEYHLKGIASVEPKILPLRRLLDLYRNHRFSVSLYPPDRRVDRWIVALRVHDAIVAGASQREIAHVLFGDDPASAAGAGRSDSLRSRVRRLAADARRMADGGYRALMRQQNR